MDVVGAILIALGLAGMAMSDPQAHLQQIAIFALLVAFGSDTQDITIDAYRIEAVGPPVAGGDGRQLRVRLPGGVAGRRRRRVLHRCGPDLAIRVFHHGLP